MFRRMQSWVWKRMAQWLETDPTNIDGQLSDFERLRHELKPCDVILVEGRSRVSNIIKTITLSSWTHAALYIGRLHDIEDPQTKELILQHYKGSPNEQLVIEALLGDGTVVVPLRKYHGFHLRICRPTGISRRDIFTVIRRCAVGLGLEYDIRQILDLARFMFPYAILPRRWRSSLFAHNAGEPTHNVCSSMIARAFHSVHFPIWPLLVHDEHGEIRLLHRNFKLFTPKDFDTSPYFSIIKYPMFAFDELAIYRNLPWNMEGGAMCNDVKECFDLFADTNISERPASAPSSQAWQPQSVNLLKDLGVHSLPVNAKKGS